MPNSALMFVACGVALIAHVRRADSVTASLAAAFVAALAAATLLEHAADVDLGIDLRVGDGDADVTHPGRPGTHTAAAFLLLGCFLLFGRWRSVLGNAVAGLCGAGAAAVVALAVAGYLTGADYLYGSAAEHGMSVHTAVGLVVVLAGGLALRPLAPPASWYARRGAGEAAARGLMLPALVIPFLAGALVEVGARLGLYSHEFATSLLIVTFAATIQGLIYLAVHVVRRHEAVREALERESRKNVQRFATLTRQAPVGIFETDPEGSRIFVNERWAEIAGVSTEEARLGHSALHPDDRAWVRPQWEAAAASGQNWGAEFRFLRPNGEVRWVACQGTAIRDGDGNLTSYMASVLDITDRRAAEARTGLVVGRIAEAVTIVGPDGHRLQANDAAQTILDQIGQLREHGPIGDQAWNLVDGEGAPLSNSRLPAEITRTSGQEVDDHVVGFPGVDGRVRWLRISTRRLTDEGPPFTVVVSFVDITAQREADARLAEADRRFELAFELAPIGVALVSLNGRLLRVNRALCDMFGYSQEELLGTSIQEVDESDDLEGDLEQFGGMLRGELSAYEMEKSFAAKDGSRVWASVSTSLVRSDDDKPLYFIAQIVDVTERRRLERELRHQAEHDSLTGLANRRVLAAELGRELARDDRYGGECSLLLIDLDGFKEVNDNFGHAIGDLVLQGAANVLRARVRDTDLAARLGGDEFAVLLPSTGRAGAEVLAMDLVHAIRELEVAPGASVTASVGVACSGELPGELDEERLLMAADDAMYEAKRGGRDRVS